MTLYLKLEKENYGTKPVLEEKPLKKSLARRAHNPPRRIVGSPPLADRRGGLPPLLTKKILTFLVEIFFVNSNRTAVDFKLRSEAEGPGDRRTEIRPLPDPVYPDLCFLWMRWESAY